MLFRSGKTPFQVKFDDQNNLETYFQDKFVIQEDFLSAAWAGLQVGLLTPYTLGGEVDRYARFLLPVVKTLPYVRTVPIMLDAKKQTKTSVGLFLNEGAGGYDQYEVDSRRDAQRCLSL